MANQSSPELVVRKMPFEFPEHIDPHWNKAMPEWSHVVNGASLATPFLEPYLIPTMRKALGNIESDELKNEVKLYMAQVGQPASEMVTAKSHHAPFFESDSATVVSLCSRASPIPGEGSSEVPGLACHLWAGRRLRCGSDYW